ncbi:MAG TPA: MFS transporter [Clostridiaceae bacterium]|nr:MFS transporter [Clostridiaceae bacterium]
MKKSFRLFLLAYSLSNFGDTLRVVAVTILIFNITGSGLSAGLSVFYSLIPGIMLSRFAGKLGDIFHPKYVLVIVELIRSIVVILFISFNDISVIFILLVILATLDVIYNPSFRKICVNLAGKDKVLRGNSLLSGVSGLTNILGSLLSVIIISTCGSDCIFLINSILHALSAAIIILLNTGPAYGYRTHYKLIQRDNKLFHSMNKKGIMQKIAFGNILESLGNCSNINVIKEIFLINVIISFCIISINMAFYPFAFDVLKVTEKGWSLIMSIFYTANILAMIISITFTKKIKKIYMLFVYVFLFIVSVIWFTYSILDNIVIILLLQLVEGISLSLCGILLLSKLQISIEPQYLSRITGLSDYINNMGKLAGTVYAYIIIKYYSVKHVFVFSSFIILSYVLFKTAISGWSHFYPVKNNIYKGKYIEVYKKVRKYRKNKIWIGD